MKELTFAEFEKMFLRFLSKNPHYYGDVLVKFFDGKIVNIRAEDSFDVKALNSLKLILKEEDNEMFIKRGASFDKDVKSSKILSEVEMDKEKNIIKESKLEKENKEEKKDEDNK